MTPLHRALLLLIALWLPVQGYAAAVMAACRHVPPAATLMTGHEHHAMASSASPKHADLAPSGAMPGCDNCQFCHICSAQALTAALAVDTTPPRAPLLVAPPQRLASLSLEGPRRPPRLART